MRQPDRSRLSRLLPALLAALALLVAPAAAAAEETGPDVSRYQHPDGKPIDWKRVKGAGADFAWIKATEGTTVDNAWFAEDWKGAGAAGLYRGAYHFARPSSAAGSGAAQARRFAATIGDQTAPGTLPPALDLESSGGLSRTALTRWVTEFLETLESRTGRRPVIYTYPSFWQDSMGGSTAFTAYPLWIAHYTKASQPSTPGWRSWSFWQYTSTSRISGVEGDVDMNRFSGTAGDLARMALAAPPEDPYATPTGVSPDEQTHTGDTDPARWSPLTPSRVLDTRTGLGGTRGPASGPVTVTLPASVPADAAGVVVNLSAVDPTGPGYLRVAPLGGVSTTTALNYSRGSSTTGLVVARTDAQRRFTVEVRGGSPQVVVDLVGYYDVEQGSGGSWMPVEPERFVDTRSGQGAPRGQVQGDLTVTLPPSVAPSARGVVLNVSAVEPQRRSFVRVAPAGTTARTTALNADQGISTTGLVLTTADAAGRVTLTVHGGPSDVVVDLVGYYDGDPSASAARAGGTDGSAYVGTAPQRLADTRKGRAGREVVVTLPGSVPAGTTAAVLNVSAVLPGGDGYLRVAPTGTVATTTAMTYSRRRSSTGLVLVRPNAQNQITVTLFGGGTDVVVDLVGYKSVPGTSGA